MKSLWQIHLINSEKRIILTANHPEPTKLLYALMGLFRNNRKLGKEYSIVLAYDKKDFLIRITSEAFTPSFTDLDPKVFDIIRVLDPNYLNHVNDELEPVAVDKANKKKLIFSREYDKKNQKSVLEIFEMYGNAEFENAESPYFLNKLEKYFND